MEPYSYPQQLDKHMGEFVFFSDGKLVLTTSNLTGRHWSASLWCFRSSEALDPEAAVAAIGVPSGIGCLASFGNSQKVFLGLDDGTVSVLDLMENNESKFNNLASASEHEDGVSTIDTNIENKEVITGSSDRVIKVWDAESLVSTSTYRDAHSDSISSLTYNPTNSRLFASCAINGEVTIWDPRLAKPARDVEIMKDYGPASSIAWTDDGDLAVGTESGNFFIQNLNNAKKPTSVVQTHRRRIHKIKPLRNTFAVCADDSQVIAVKLSPSGESTISYNDDRHSDFVRGLSWHPVTSHLYSSGFDKQILCHQVEP